MENNDKLFFARNELENVIDSLQQTLKLSEQEMMIVVEMVLSTARHKTMIRNIYNQIKPPKKEESENGNTNEKGQ